MQAHERQQEQMAQIASLRKQTEETASQAATRISELESTLETCRTVLARDPGSERSEGTGPSTVTKRRLTRRRNNMTPRPRP